eukprot:4364215-Amphidinium_carterae.1
MRLCRRRPSLPVCSWAVASLSTGRMVLACAPRKRQRVEGGCSRSMNARGSARPPHNRAYIHLHNITPNAVIILSMHMNVVAKL